MVQPKSASIEAGGGVGKETDCSGSGGADWAKEATFLYPEVLGRGQMRVRGADSGRLYSAPVATSNTPVCRSFGM